MGQRGPQPQPNVLKLIRGNPGKRPMNLADGVNPAVEIPDMPRFLCAEARKEWRRLTPLLAELGLISKLDRAALALHCQAWGRLVQLEVALEKRMQQFAAEGRDPVEATIDTAPSGYRQQSALVSMINNLRDQVSKYLASFGLSPSSRSRVTPSANTGQLGLPGVEADPLGAKLAQLRQAGV